jgi:hypothetical protein
MLTFLYVLVEDVDEQITIGPCVLVPETDHMSEFVHNDAELVTVFTNRYRLRSVATFAHKRTASVIRISPS